MKKIILILCVLFITAASYAQKPNDSLFMEKFNIIQQYLPVTYWRPSYEANMIEPQDFLARLDSFKKAAYNAIDEKDATKKQILVKDVDAYARIILNAYAENYGIDSAKENAYWDALSAADPKDSASLQKAKEAENARFVKRMPEDTKKHLQSMAMDGFPLNDSALFFNSTAYRQLTEIKLRQLMVAQYRTQLENGANERLIRQQLLNQELGKGYVYEYYSYQNIEYVLNISTDSAEVASLYNLYMKNARDQVSRKKIADSYYNFRTYTNNSPAPNFAYRDINGKTVTLKQLRGKYVYIDIWATWCGPCKMEIPHLTKLEEEYAGKKIHFVSLSIDKQKDKGAWEKYVRTKNLKGIQLMADKDIESDFIRKFNIMYIPRFLLIGPDGRIVDANAKRPSDETLRTQLNQLL